LEATPTSQHFLVSIIAQTEKKIFSYEISWIIFWIHKNCVDEIDCSGGKLANFCTLVRSAIILVCMIHCLLKNDEILGNNDCNTKYIFLSEKYFNYFHSSLRNISQYFFKSIHFSRWGEGERK
jgi:hypothetical protein